MVFLDIASQLGISPALFAVVMVWSTVWKLIAFWKSARNNQLVWFILFGIVNTLGILEIIYITLFQKKRKR